MGYSFIWKANASPWLVSPKGARIDLEVHGGIPFLRMDATNEIAMVARIVSPSALISDGQLWQGKSTLVLQRTRSDADRAGAQAQLSRVQPLARALG